MFSVAGVKEWSAYVTAHRKANDDHIRLLHCPPGGQVRQVGVTEDQLAIRIPFGLDDADNYVLGLALDRCYREDIPHPLDPLAPDIPSCPTLMVATTDGVLRFYR